MLGYLSQIERAPGPDSGAIRHVTAILGHRWQAGTLGFYTTTAPRQLELGLDTMTHTEGSAGGCLQEGRLGNLLALLSHTKEKKNVI